MKMRRIKQNKYTQKIDAEIDLHGMTQTEARRELLLFLDEAASEPWQRVRIITGKGIHSENGIGVLRELTETVLNSKGLSFVEAKIGDGGSGALVVKIS
jgi:DNA-nicking Smr family endonuclease